MMSVSLPWLGRNFVFEKFCCRAWAETSCSGSFVVVTGQELHVRRSFVVVIGQKLRAPEVLLSCMESDPLG